jgi:hypothetical protein
MNSTVRARTSEAAGPSLKSAVACAEPGTIFSSFVLHRRGREERTSNRDIVPFTLGGDQQQGRVKTFDSGPGVEVSIAPAGLRPHCPLCGERDDRPRLAVELRCRRDHDEAAQRGAEPSPGRGTQRAARRQKG